MSLRRLQTVQQQGIDQVCKPQPDIWVVAGSLLHWYSVSGLASNEYIKKQSANEPQVKGNLVMSRAKGAQAVDV